MREPGIAVVPYHPYLIPGLRFDEESLAFYEDFLGTRLRWNGLGQGEGADVVIPRPVVMSGNAQVAAISYRAPGRTPPS